jgi:two-component system, LuxR family, response regulator FixJ
MSIALIEDDEAVLDSLRALLASRGLFVRCFNSVERFLEGVEKMRPSCIVSDVLLPGLSGLDLQRELKRRNSPIPLILITGHGDIAMAVTAMREGAFDFLEKPYDAERLIASIEAALAAEQRLRLEGDERARLMERIAELSPRQRQVMELVAEGLSSKQIALQLGISPRTVENYRAWVMERMDAANLADLIRKVLLLRDKG